METIGYRQYGTTQLLRDRTVAYTWDNDLSKHMECVCVLCSLIFLVVEYIIMDFFGGVCCLSNGWVVLGGCIPRHDCLALRGRVLWRDSKSRVSSLFVFSAAALVAFRVSVSWVV